LGKSAKTIKRIRQTRPPLAQALSVENYKLLFIGGLHRSGTSVLHRLLREHPSASGFTDTGVPEDEGQHLQSVFPPAYEYGGPGAFAFDLRSHLTEESSLITSDNRNKLLREWGAYFDLSKELLLEKSPPNLLRSRFFQALFPGACFVFVIRHPIAVALATQKWAKTSIVELLLHWHVAYSIMLADLAHIERYCLMRYEDFVESPRSHLDEICRLVGVDGITPRETVINHNPKYFSIWKQGYARDREVIDSLFPAGGPLETFGYSFSEPYVRTMTIPARGLQMVNTSG
jgi:hypothetical protein